MSIRTRAYNTCTCAWTWVWTCKRVDTTSIHDRAVMQQSQMTSVAATRNLPFCITASTVAATMEHVQLLPSPTKILAELWPKCILTDSCSDQWEPALVKNKVYELAAAIHFLMLSTGCSCKHLQSSLIWSAVFPGSLSDFCAHLSSKVCSKMNLTHGLIFYQWRKQVVIANRILDGGIWCDQMRGLESNSYHSTLHSLSRLGGGAPERLLV